ncbi:hypothetical protein ETC02_17740, partial [Geobacillus sp. DSP4a]|nr:hypothetical protein [Geobacillus sp. DSP4a]
MAAGARQYEKRKRRVRLSKPNVLHPEGCWHPEGEGYLAEESQALELDRTKSGGSRVAAMGKCSSPARVLAPGRRRLFDPEQRRAGAGHQSLFKANRASVSFSFEGT